MENRRPTPDQQTPPRNAEEEKRLAEQSVAQVYMAYLLNTPEESISGVVLQEKSGKRRGAESHVIFKTEEPLQSRSVADVSRRLTESLGLTARKRGDGVHVSGSGKTAREILSLLGETRDVFEVFDEIEARRNQPKPPPQ